MVFVHALRQRLDFVIRPSWLDGIPLQILSMKYAPKTRRSMIYKSGELKSVPHTVHSNLCRSFFPHSMQLAECDIHLCVASDVRFFFLSRHFVQFFPRRWFELLMQYLHTIHLYRFFCYIVENKNRDTTTKKLAAFEVNKKKKEKSKCKLERLHMIYDDFIVAQPTSGYFTFGQCGPTADEWRWSAHVFVLISLRFNRWFPHRCSFFFFIWRARLLFS